MERTAFIEKMERGGVLKGIVPFNQHTLSLCEKAFSTTYDFRAIYTQTGSVKMSTLGTF